MPQSDTVSHCDPISLLTQHGCTHWLDEQEEWLVRQLDELMWLAECHREDTYPLYEVILGNWGLVEVGLQ
jgi:hypothetical protein